MDCDNRVDPYYVDRIMTLKLIPHDDDFIHGTIEYGGIITGRFGSEPDWCFPNGSRRRRETNRYDYDAYFQWRDFDKKNPPEGLDCIYSDRMSQWDYEKFQSAREAAGKGWIEDISREQAERIIELYYDGEYTCVGYGAVANASNGYGIGIFFVQKTEDMK